LPFENQFTLLRAAVFSMPPLPLVIPTRERSETGGIRFPFTD
jgi:hypothetical protein